MKNTTIKETLHMLQAGAVESQRIRIGKTGKAQPKVTNEKPPMKKAA